MVILRVNHHRSSSRRQKINDTRGSYEQRKVSSTLPPLVFPSVSHSLARTRTERHPETHESIHTVGLFATDPLLMIVVTQYRHHHNII